MIHIKTDEIYGKNDIQNPNDHRTHLVSLDSRFRNTVTEPATNFLYRFAHPYKNVIQARVASVEIPNGFYTFSRAKKNTMFRLDAADYTDQLHFLTITIPDGDYTPECLIQQIQEQFRAVKDTYGLFFRITYDALSRRTTLTLDGSAPPPCPPGPTHCPTPFALTFMMVGHEERAFDFGLGSHLGFVKPFYTVEDPYTISSESLVQTTGDNYLLLAIDDFHTVEHKTNDSYLQCLAKILVKRNPQGIIFDDGYTVLSNTITFPRPVDLKQVRIKLMDPYGVPLELHNLNFSLSLEIIEVMNLQMYNHYRTYLWDKSTSQTTLTRDTSLGPRATTHISGSSAGIAPPAMNYA